MNSDHSSNQDSGSFATGFTLGIFAGAAGYFLFATDRGEKIRQELQHEWHDAQKRMTEEGHHFPSETVGEMEAAVVRQVKPKALELKKALQQAVTNWLALDEAAEEKKASSSKGKKAKKTSKNTSAKSSNDLKQKKFKGT